MSMSDRDEILSLTANYNYTFDEGDVDEWLKCWTEDGYFARPSGSPSARGLIELRELRENFHTQGRHVVTDHDIRVHESTATQKCYCLYFDTSPGSNAALIMCGVYRDRLERRPEGWRFSERLFEPEYIAKDPASTSEAT